MSLERRPSQGAVRIRNPAAFKIGCVEAGPPKRELVQCVDREDAATEPASANFAVCDAMCFLATDHDDGLPGPLEPPWSASQASPLAWGTSRRWGA
jgi:hypothetical protein